MWGDFQICISVPLKTKRKSWCRDTQMLIKKFLWEYIFYVLGFPFRNKYLAIQLDIVQLGANVTYTSW